MARMEKADKTMVCLRREDFRAIENWAMAFRFGDLGFLILEDLSLIAVAWG